MLRENAPWSFESSVYLGVDEEGLVQARSVGRPSGAVIIHDLGHALLTPPALLRFDQAPLSFDRPGALQAFLLGQRQFGRIALPAHLEGGVQAHFLRALQALGEKAPRCLRLPAPKGGARRLLRASTEKTPELVGALDVKDPLDFVAWDLDAPQLRSLPEQDACELIWSGHAGACAKEIWIAGQRIT